MVEGGQKSVNLALQGGGAHGAFTWGVLDKLLEDGRICIAAISGTSAGAMNAVVVADGLVEGGREGARAALERFWSAVSVAARTSPIQRGPLDVFLGNWSLEHNPSFVWLDFMQRLASPYDFNPLNINPLQQIVEAEVDFERVRACHEMKVFISATDVETGRVKVFEPEKLDATRVMASAALPQIYQAVEVEGVPYWDGGFMGNPALFPLFGATGSDDIIIVQINPVERKGAPRTARDIANRVNEITFNASLLRELRAIEFVDRLIEDGTLKRASHHEILVHIIDGAGELAALGSSSKVNAEWEFLRHLFDIGRSAADRWLEAHYDKLGVQSTINLRALFAG